MKTLCSSGSPVALQLAHRESWSLSFSRQDEEFLQNAVNSAPFILIVGQSCSARYQLLNFLLGERLLPLGAEAGGACGAEGGACRRRKLCFTHGRQKRLSLALPGQYELVHQLAAHCGCWDTVPREDLEIQECEDPAQRLAELDITLHHTLLQVRLSLPSPGEAQLMLCWRSSSGLKHSPESSSTELLELRVYGGLVLWNLTFHLERSSMSVSCEVAAESSCSQISSGGSSHSSATFTPELKSDLVLR
ncbi:hypothetical protein DNTS_029354 [Danionella cerebrum]|uniref:Uncharacterized protein n=1 Tax=Danionella cerebrum TaxID=2873325 RepID=A0A553Q7W1_9TELE|nr:hypothetical protein DNTS_029354 [Danionella translucida]